MSNPFLDGSLVREKNVAIIKHERAIADGLEMVKDSGVNVGDIVTVSWRVDDAFGGGIRSHVGELSEMGHVLQLEASTKSPGTLRIGIASIHGIRVERVLVPDKVAPATNPFMTNPFMP